MYTYHPHLGDVTQGIFCVRAGVAEDRQVEVNGVGGTQVQQNTLAIGQRHRAGAGWVPDTLLAHFWCGVFSSKSQLQKQKRGRGESTQLGEVQVLPSKLVLELFAVHMPICFVIAWLFLEATGVSRKPESVDYVSWVWGV